MPSPNLCVLILQYNQPWLTVQLLNSLYACEQVKNMHIVVVDNASTEGDGFEEMKRDFPGIELVKNTQNLGFARAINKESKRLCQAFEYILLLNNDVVIKYDVISRCMEELIRLRADVISCTMHNVQGQWVSNFSMHPAPWIYLMFNMTGLCTLWRERLIRRKRACRVYYLDGTFLMMQSRKFQEVQFFCDDFFMFSEDLDLMFRLNKAGARMYYLPHESFIHLECASGRAVWSESEKTSIRVRQDIQVYHKHHHRHWVRLYVWGRFAQQRLKHFLLKDEVAALYADALRPFLFRKYELASA